MSSDTLPVVKGLFDDRLCAPVSQRAAGVLRVLFLPLILQIMLFTGVFAVGLSSVWSWQLLTVFYYFLPLLLLPGARIFLRLFDLGLLSLFFMLGVAKAPFFLTAGLFFGLLGACRVYRDSFFLRFFSGRLHFLPVLTSGLQSLFSGFLSLACFNFFIPADTGDSLGVIIWAAAGCSIFWSLGTAFDLRGRFPLKTRQKAISAKNLDLSYKEMMERFMNLSNRIVTHAEEQKDHGLLDFMTHLQHTGGELICRGNELFIFLREMKKGAGAERFFGDGIRDNEGEPLLQEREEILRQKAILLAELDAEEKKLWGTLENMILRMDNLSLSLIGKKGSFLFDSSSEIGILNRKMEEAVVFLDEKRKAIKLLSDG